MSGDGQEAQAGTVLSPFVVRVGGLDGSPRKGVAVSWSPWAGDGSVEPESARSDTEGLVKAYWTLGADFGAQAGP